MTTFDIHVVPGEDHRSGQSDLAYSLQFECCACGKQGLGPSHGQLAIDHFPSLQRAAWLSA